MAAGMVALLAATLSGCATNRYVAAELPREWQADLTQNSQTLELTKIASPTTQNDLISRGDVLEINIAAGFSPEDNLEFTARVSDEGTVLLPDLGNVQLEGLELEAAESQIGSLCQQQGLYRSPQVTVTMKAPKVNNITVIGAVKKPKTYQLRSGASSLLDAIVAAEGLAEDAGTQVEIRHPGYQNSRSAPRIAALDGQPGGNRNVAYEEVASASGMQTVKVDLVSATEQGQGGYYLPDGSIVNVERRDPLPIHVAGLVKRAGSYDYPLGKELRLLDAISLAEGISNPLANNIIIIRKKPEQQEPIVIQASLRKAKRNLGLDNPLLAPGDYVSLEQTPSTATYEAVKLIGFGISGRAFSF